MSLALFGATGLPLIVAIVGIGQERGDISDSVGASLIGAGMISVLVYPFVATRLAGVPAPVEGEARRVLGLRDEQADRPTPPSSFFAELASRGHEPLLRKASGSMRFDVVDGRRTRRWLVAVERGDMTVRSGSGDASCVVRADKAVFDKVASGTVERRSRRCSAATSRSKATGVSSCACSGSFPGPPAEEGDRVNDGLVKILDGNTFVVSDARGDIEASFTDPTGLFSFDTRFLSRWVLTVNGERLNPLSVDDLQYFETRFFLVPGTGTVYIDAKLSVIRQRAVSTGFHEELTILNHADKPVSLTVRIDAGCDFADLFEVKDALRKKGRYSAKVERRKLTLGYERGPFARATAITASAPATFDAEGLTFTVKVPAHGEWTHGHRRRHRAPGRGAGSARATGSEARPGADAAQPRALDRRRASRRVRLGAAEGHVSPEPRRPRGAAVLAADRRRSRASRCRSPVVHDDVRPRQHLHEPAGAAVHAGARRDDAPRARRLAGRAASTTSATRIRAGSSTRCATGR